MLESNVCHYETGFTEILQVRCGLGWINSNFKGGTNNGSGHWEMVIMKVLMVNFVMNF